MSQHGSAAILAMSSTILVPIGNFAFSLDFMPGHKPQRPTDLAGLFVIMLGLFVFRYFEQVRSVVRVRVHICTKWRSFARSNTVLTLSSQLLESCLENKLARSQSKAEMLVEKMATSKSAAFVALSGPGTGLDRPLGEVMLQNTIRRERRRVNLLRR